MGLCADSELRDYQIHSTLKSFKISCYTGSFSLVALMMMASAAGVFYGSSVMRRYRSYISIDNL